MEVCGAVSVQLAYADQGYAGHAAEEAAANHGIQLEVKHTEPKHGSVLLPRRWVLEKSFAWARRFCKLARDCERLLRDARWIPLLRLRMPHAS